MQHVPESVLVIVYQFIATDATDVRSFSQTCAACRHAALACVVTVESWCGDPVDMPDYGGRWIRRKGQSFKRLKGTSDVILAMAMEQRVEWAHGNLSRTWHAMQWECSSMYPISMQLGTSLAIAAISMFMHAIQLGAAAIILSIPASAISLALLMGFLHALCSNPPSRRLLSVCFWTLPSSRRIVCKMLLCVALWSIPLLAWPVSVYLVFLRRSKDSE